MQKVPPEDGHRRLPRLVGGWFLLVLGGGLVLVAVLAGVSSVINGDIGAISGGVFVLIAASVLAQFGRVVLRGGNRPPPTVAASGPGSERAPHGQRSPLAGPPRDPSVRYREWCCQFPPAQTLLARIILAGAIGLIVAVGGASSPGPQGLLFLLPAVPGIHLFAVLLYLPYGIRLGGGRLRVGVRGVPRMGRIWRREDVPLDAVVS